MDDLPSLGEALSFSIEVGGHAEGDASAQYKELEVGKRSPEVPDEAMQAELDRLRESFARLESVDRGAQQGDHLVMDFVGSVDGEPFKGGEARDYMLEIGGGRLIEGFEEQLIGARAGERAHGRGRSSPTNTTPRSCRAATPCSTCRSRT